MEEERIARTMVDLIDYRLHDQMPIGTCYRRGGKGLALVTPGWKLHTLLILPYRSKPLILRLHLNHYRTDGWEYRALGVDERKGLGRHLVHGETRLELSFAPDEHREVAEWMTTWLPLLDRETIPIDYPMEESHLHPDNLRTVGYIWTARAQELYARQAKPSPGNRGVSLYPRQENDDAKAR